MTKVVSRIGWTGIKYQLTGREYDLSNDDVSQISDMLLRNRCIGLSYRKTHLSSYLIMLGHFWLTGRWSKWSHVWINIDDEENTVNRIRVFEAVSDGVLISPFWKVILCDAVVLLKPKYLAEDEWDKINVVLMSQQGKRYDVFCNPEDSSEVNCCELVASSMLDVDSYCLPGLKLLMRRYGNLTPQMFLECGDFEVVLEIRR